MFFFQGNLSSINILEILIDGGGGDLVERYNETQNISDMDRQEIVRIIMADLTNKTGNLYPSSEMKERTAKALVEFFPCLAIHRPGVTPHCHFFNCRTGGFFDNRLRTMRKTLSPSNRKRKTPKKSAQSSKKNPRTDNEQRKNLLESEDNLFKV